ncbi:MAG TPA: serine hydrolase, partial [Gammaproteobacteria bacterium]|nr:serine hydrolase [Gammaproteobacteria bacterium]
TVLQHKNAVKPTGVRAAMAYTRATPPGIDPMRVPAVLLAAGILALTLAFAPARADDLDAYVQTTMVQWKVPGIAVAVVKDGQVVLARGYGRRELGKPGKVDAATLFGIASNSKAFTAAALGTLESAGKLGWDDPVIDYLPGFRLESPYVTRALTVRDLLTHRSGYCDPTFMWLTGGFDSREIVHRLRFQKPQYGLRERFCYNNTMYLAAGEIVPAITGESWDDYVAAHFFAPLGMKRSTSRMAALAKDADVAVPHAEIDGKVVPIPRMDTDSMAPVGGIKSSVADLSHWILMLLADGKYQGRTILDPGIVRTMEAPQMLIARDSEIGEWALAQTPNSQFLAYGLGFFVEDYGGHKLVWHAGDIDGMASALAMIPDEHLGVVVLSNMNQNRAPEAIVFHVLAGYLGLPARDVSGALQKLVKSEEAPGKKLDARLAAARDPAAKPSLPLADYAGRYRNQFVGDVTVAYRNDALVLAFGNPAFTATLVPGAHDTFKAPWRDRVYGDSWVSFDLDALGHAEALRFAGIPYEFTRVTPAAAPEGQ